MGRKESNQTKTSQSLRGCIKQGVLFALYMPEAGGPQRVDTRTENSSSKLNLNLSDRLSERCFHKEPFSECLSIHHYRYAETRSLATRTLLSI